MFDNLNEARIENRLSRKFYFNRNTLIPKLKQLFPIKRVKDFEITVIVVILHSQSKSHHDHCTYQGKRNYRQSVKEIQEEIRENRRN